jgi:hypothetical protein
MKSLSVNTLSLLFLILYEIPRINYKSNFFVNTISGEKLPRNDIKITSDQNLLNLNANFNKEKILDFVNKKNKNSEISNSQENTGENFLKNRNILQTEPIFPRENYLIKSIDTIIVLKQNQTNGEVKEKISFELSRGKFSSLTRKISLHSSAEKFSNFKLSS